MLLDYKTTKMRFQKTYLLCRVTIGAKIGSSCFISQVIISYIEGLPIVFIEISSQRIKVGVTFIFRHLLDVMTQWYTSNVFESTLNNLKLFLVCLPTQYYSILYLEGKKSFGESILSSGLCRASPKPASCSNEKVG